MYWVIGLIALLVIGYLLDREIYTYEGVRLGPRVQAWLYDRWAAKYDAGKHESQVHDDRMLAQPLLEKLSDIPEPFILDFATGTGRMSIALLNRHEFNGHIIALDLSQKMLEQASAKINGTVPDKRTHVEFLRQQNMPLPFPDGAFDTVCCLEVLELLPDAETALKEMARLLRPGGILLSSRGTEAAGPGRRARIKSETEMASMLERSGFENIQITKWWKWFDRVLANKKGTSQPVGTRSLSGVLKCSSCGSVNWTVTSDSWRCGQCHHTLALTQDGIVLS